jgi:hypothetical protein
LAGVPNDLLVGATGRRDASSGHYRADQVRASGSTSRAASSFASGTPGHSGRSIFRPNMRECAELLETAADAVEFYRRRFGVYPQPT